MKSWEIAYKYADKIEKDCQGYITNIHKYAFSELRSTLGDIFIVLSIKYPEAFQNVLEECKRKIGE